MAFLTYLLINLVSTEIIVCYIISIVLFLLLNILIMMISQLSYKESIINIIAILS